MKLGIDIFHVEYNDVKGFFKSNGGKWKENTHGFSTIAKNVPNSIIMPFVNTITDFHDSATCIKYYSLDHVKYLWSIYVTSLWYLKGYKLLTPKTEEENDFILKVKHWEIDDDDV